MILTRERELVYRASERILKLFARYRLKQISERLAIVGIYGVFGIARGKNDYHLIVRTSYLFSDINSVFCGHFNIQKHNIIRLFLVLAQEKIAIGKGTDLHVAHTLASSAQMFELCGIGLGIVTYSILSILCLL